MLGVLAGAVTSSADAASWDPFPGTGVGDGFVSGGNGLWDLFSPNWTNDNGLTNVPWSNGSPAVFGGASGGTVTISGGSGVSVSSLTFDPTSNFIPYTIQSQTFADVLTLAGPLVTTNQDATINAVISGAAGLTKQGAGTLTLGPFNTFSGPVTVQAGRLRVAGTASLGSATSLSIGSGATFESTGPLTFGGNVSIDAGGGTIALASPAAAVTLQGILSGNAPLVIDGSGGGSLAVTNPANFNGLANSFTGSISLVGGGSVTLSHPVLAPAGQAFSATAGTMTLGGSVPGAGVLLSSGSIVQASGNGVVQLYGRGAGPGVGVIVGGDVNAINGGRVSIGDGLDDSAQIAFVNSSRLTADNGTVTLRPRVTPLTLDPSTINTLAIRNGGVLALGAGNADLILNTDVAESGPWTLANQSANTFRITGTSQDNTAGLTLRAESGLLRYEVDAITLGAAPVNGVVNADLRGGTLDINNSTPGKTFNYTPGYTVSGWGQLGTSAANQTHVIPLGGATFFASATNGAALNVVGGFNELAGSKAQFRIGDNAGLLLTVPSANAYVVANVSVDPQGALSIARFGAAGGTVQANRAAFGATANRLRFDIPGGILVSDIADTGTLLVNTPGSQPITVSAGGAFITTSPTFLLNPNETIGGAGTLFAPGSGTPTNLTLRGTVDLNGVLGGSINTASNGTLKLDTGESLTLAAPADLAAMTLAYNGPLAAPATLEVNALASLVRLYTSAPIATAAGFAGSREFKTTAGTLQVDSAGTPAVTITGSNQLVVDRGVNSLPGNLLGTLTLNGGNFQIGPASAGSTNTVALGATLTGFGTFGHTTTADVFINAGLVQAVGGTLTLSAGELRSTGTFDPNGQSIVFTGALKNGATPTALLVTGANGGTVQLGSAGTYTGGTVIDGSAGINPVTLRATASGSLGSAGITLNFGVLQLIANTSLSFASNNVTLVGDDQSTINYDHLSGIGSQTHTIGKVTVDGQVLKLQGPPTSAYNVTLTMNGLAVGTNGATLVNTGSSPVRTGAVTLDGNLLLQLSSSDFRLGALSGAGLINRTALSGTLNFNSSSPTYTGMLTSSVGTTNFNAANALGTGRFQFGVGTVGAQVNITAAGAFNAASGTVQAGALNLNVAGALDGSQITLAGGSVVTSIAGSLGTGVLQLAGGELVLRGNGNTSFGGTINVNLPGSAPGFISVAQTGVTTSGVLTVSALNVNNQLLNLVSKTATYGLGVASATTISGTAGSTIDNEMAAFNTPILQLNGGLTITGSGNASIGQLGGAGPLKIASPNGSVTLTGAPLPDFASAVQITGGTVNLNTAASFRNGSVLINGGTLNLGVANALDATPVSLVSGFLSANAANALFGKTLPVTNGTLFSTAANALNGAVVNLTGGNVTATAPAALAGSTINITDAILALRADPDTAFNGNVVITGTNFSTVSVAGVTDNGPTGRLSIDSLTFGGQTLNVTGGDGHVFAVVNPVTLVGSAPTTINTTAADAIFLGAFNGAGALVKNGQRTLTLDNGATVATTTVSAGTLVVNGPFNSTGVTVGNATNAATLQLGGAGVNAPGNITINNGTLRISKANPADALPAATIVSGGANGNVRVDYAGFSTATLTKNINVDATATPRTLTLSASSGASAAQASTLTYTGSVTRTGANALTIVAQADSALDDGFGNLIRPASRIVLASNQTFDVQHGGGIVIGKGTINASGSTPFGTSTAALAMNVMDSTVGGMVADGQTIANWSRSITTNAGSPRKRLGAFYNPLGAPAQTISYQSGFTFAWNDATLPLYVITPPGNPAGAMANSLWNGMIADPGTSLLINPGVQLDNILTASGTNLTTAPVYVGGGGTVRFASGFNESSYRSLATAKGLAGSVVVLDNTTFQSQTTGHHFDGVELRSGTYQTSTSAQTLAGGFAVTPSPFDPTRLTSNLVTDTDLTLTGTGPANAFRLATNTSLTKSGAGALNVNGDQLHAPGSTLVATQGTVNLNTDSGTPGANTLSITSIGANFNLNTTQHLAQITLTAGTAKLASGPTTGSRTLDATAVSVTGLGKLDLTNGRLIVDYAPGNSPISSIRQQIVAGLITSSTAAASPTVFGVGFGEASDLLGPAGGAFGTETVDASSVIARYTTLGDATLDGQVDFNDLVKLAQNYNQTTGNLLWSQGDFTYDGNVDFNDLVKLAQNYNTTLAAPAIPGAPADFQSDLAAAFASVPEPTTGAWLTACGGVAGLLHRRRRRRTGC